MIVDGALLQRATSVRPSHVVRDINLEIPLSPELPFGFSGYEGGDTVQTSRISSLVFQATIRGKPVKAPPTRCGDDAICSGKVLAPGVVIERCESRTWPFTAEMRRDPHARWGDYHYKFNRTSPTGIDAFYVNPAFKIDIVPLPYYQNFTRAAARAQSEGPNSTTKPEGARVMTDMVSWSDMGPSEFVWRTCLLSPAVLEYSIQIASGQIILPPDMGSLRQVALANNTVRSVTLVLLLLQMMIVLTIFRYNPFVARGPQPQRATMDAFTFALETTYNANATAVFYIPEKHGTWLLVPESFNSVVSRYYNWNHVNTELNFTDPLPSIVATMNELMFRGGLATANWPNIADLIDSGLTVNQTMHGRRQTKENVFHSDYRWFAGAAILDVLAIMTVLPLFFGWCRS